MQTTNNARGSVIVWLVLCMPIAVLFVAATVCIGLTAFEKTKLQSAVDMAAYAGAASLANSLNEIAVKNKQINDEYRSLEKDFNDDSQQNGDAAAERFRKYQNVPRWKGSLIQKL